MELAGGGLRDGEGTGAMAGAISAGRGVMAAARARGAPALKVLPPGAKAAFDGALSGG